MSLFRLLLVVAIIYLGLLFSGYGVLIGSEKKRRRHRFAM